MTKLTRGTIRRQEALCPRRRRRLTARLGHPVIALLLALGCWQAALGQQPGRSSYFVHDPSLLAPASRFGDLEISLPRGFTPLPDSLRQALDELGQSGDEAFAYRVHGLFRGPDGTAISVREALGVSPDSGFSYLARYAPATSTGERLEYSANQVRMDSIVFREYRFVRFGHIVRQLFSHSPRHVYVIDYLVKGSWQKSTIHTYESMVSSMRFVPATTPREGRATP